MRPAMLAGIVLILAGSFVLFRGLTYTKDESVLKIGELEATVKEKKEVPSWIGAVALAGGAVLLVGSMRKRPPGGSS
jgi:hypothetical protein